MKAIVTFVAAAIIVHQSHRVLINRDASAIRYVVLVALCFAAIVAVCGGKP